MGEPSTETKRAIVKMVIPNLSYGGDPDVERYFDLRRDGRMSQALGVYNRALRVRYPDDSSRVLLLKLFRQRNPQYAALQDRLILEFASKLILRIEGNIDTVVAPLDHSDLSDALRALKAVESVLARLPGDTAEAIALLERYERFAATLDYRRAALGRALSLLREYDAVSRVDDSSDYDFVAKSAALEERRRAKAAGAAKSEYREENYDFVERSAEHERRRRSEERSSRFFDPSRIKFSAADRARIEISPGISRREDLVLAYCAKYWALVGDPGFERTVFLYSRKYGGKHFEIFRAVKIGRARKATDDEILSAVSAILSTSYSYSMRGDLYMQVMWRRIRARMEAKDLAERMEKPAPRPRTRESARESSPDLRSRPEATERESATGLRAASRAAAPPERREPFTAPARRLDPNGELGIGTKPAPQVERRIPPAETRHGMESRPAASLDPEPMTEAEPQSAASPSLRPADKARGARLFGRAPSGYEPLGDIKEKRGSISDTIRKLSGRNYDVYKEIFLEKVRDHIRRALIANQTRGHGIFDTAANEAEDQVYGFIAAHYDDHFMDWEHSAEREAVETLGFSMPSLGPIIESCFKKL